MSSSEEPRLSPAEVVGDPKTKKYEPNIIGWWVRPVDLPPFTFLTVQAMMLDPMIRLGLAMRLAPLQTVRLAHKVGEDWQDGVESDDPRLAQWVYQTFYKIWQIGLYKLAQCQAWGWSAAEFVFKYDPVAKLLVVDDVLDRHARDVKVRVKGGRPVGVRFERVLEDNGKAWVDLDFPKCCWLSHFPEPGMFYGRQILLGAYSPWADKWFNGAALDVRRLFMHKDAYGGADMTYPPGTTNIDGKGEIPNMEIARQIVEQMQSGAVTTRPYEPDEKGNNKWNLTRATVPANPAHILQYPKDLDVEILRGMEIPDDVLMSGATGAWEGKKVPMMTFLTGVDSWGSQMIYPLDRQVIRPIAEMNFGHSRYRLNHMPLVEQFFSEGGKDPQTKPGSPGGGQDQGGGGQDVPEFSTHGGSGGDSAGTGAAGVKQMSALAGRAWNRAQRRLREAKKTKIFVMSGEASHIRAPEGGVRIDGKYYPGGQFIPKAVVDAMDPKERKSLEDYAAGQDPTEGQQPDQEPGQPQPPKGDGQTTGRFSGVGVVAYWDHLMRMNYQWHRTDEDLLKMMKKEFPMKEKFQDPVQIREWFNAGKYGLGPPPSDEPLRQFVKSSSDQGDQPGS